MNHLTDNSFSAYVGIDWADLKHDICVQAAGDQHREFDCIPHQVVKIEQWAQSLHKRFGGVIAIALELSKAPIVSALQKYDFFVIFPINPSTLAKYREAFKPSRAKDDPTFASQFKGKSILEPLKVKADGGDVDALSGATMTSRGICAALMDASDIYKRLKSDIKKNISA